MKYEKPKVTMIEADFSLLAASGPGADDIGSPNVLNDAKEYSIWDEDDETHYNNTKEEQENEDWN